MDLYRNRNTQLWFSPIRLMARCIANTWGTPSLKTLVIMHQCAGAWDSGLVGGQWLPAMEQGQDWGCVIDNSAQIHTGFLGADDGRHWAWRWTLGHTQDRIPALEDNGSSEAPQKSME